MAYYSRCGVSCTILRAYIFVYYIEMCLSMVLSSELRWVTLWLGCMRIPRINRSDLEP